MKSFNLECGDARLIKECPVDLGTNVYRCDWFLMLPDQVILLHLSFILICKFVIQHYSDELYSTPFYKSCF